MERWVLRCLLCAVLLVLGGCDYGFELHTEELGIRELYERAELVLKGQVVEEEFEFWPGFAMREEDGGKLWQLLRRKIRVEAIYKGYVRDRYLDVYEVAWTGVLVGQMNRAPLGGRYTFLLRQERGRWRTILDHRPNTFSGDLPDRLPLDENAPFWKRYALGRHSLGPGRSVRPEMFLESTDPGMTLSRWERTRLLLELMRNEDRTVRLAACAAMEKRLRGCQAEFEEWDQVWGQTYLRDEFAPKRWTSTEVERERRFFRLYVRLIQHPKSAGEKEAAKQELRLATLVSHEELRNEACRLWRVQFPQDKENGCSLEVFTQVLGRLGRGPRRSWNWAKA